MTAGNFLRADGPAETLYCRFLGASKSKTRGSLTVWVLMPGDTGDIIVVSAT